LERAFCFSTEDLADVEELISIRDFGVPAFFFPWRGSLRDNLLYAKELWLPPNSKGGFVNSFRCEAEPAGFEARQNYHPL
jgi:hypothetical protein